MTSRSAKTTFPVLAYPSSDAAARVPLSLVFRYARSELWSEITICLQQQLDSVTEGLGFVLQYDADNLVPGAASLSPAVISLPQTLLEGLARPGRPRMSTLRLRLKRCPPVYSPAPTAVLSPALATLAKATELCIVFDYKVLLPEQCALFDLLVKGAEGLRGFDVARYYKPKWRLYADVHELLGTNADPPPYATGGADVIRGAGGGVGEPLWGELGEAREQAGVDSDATTEDELPPYPVANGKRHGMSTPSNPSPPSCRPQD